MSPSFAVSGFQVYVIGFDEVDASGRSGGYTQPANRTLFPLSNGLIVWEASHSEWTSKLFPHRSEDFTAALTYVVRNFPQSE